MGPLFAWVSAIGKFERMKLPKLAILVMKFLSRALSGSSRAQQIGNCQGMVQEVFRTDARAEGAEIWIGGWALDHHDRSRCLPSVLTTKMPAGLSPLGRAIAQ